MSIIREFIDENTNLTSRINGCDDASITALRAVTGMTNSTSTFPAARFRPAPRFDASARPRQSPPGGGLGGRRLSPRDASIDVRTAIESSIARSRGAPGRRVGGRAARHARDPDLANAGIFATFRVAEGCKKFANRAVSARDVLFVFFAHLQLLFAASPFSRLAVDNICGVAAEFRTGKSDLSFGDYDYGAFSMDATAELANGLNHAYMLILSLIHI